MNLNDIKTGTGVILDANILIYASQKVSRQCERLLDRCLEEDVNGIIALHVLAEVMHKTMINEARDNHWITGPNPTRQLSGQPDRVRSLSRYEGMVRDILALGFQLEPVIPEDFISAMAIQRRTGLLTNDALLMAVGQRLRVDTFASADKTFNDVPGILLYVPDDITE